MDESRISRIVLTGGPCGEKSTALTSVSERLKDHGIRVYRVPEAATILFGGGAPKEALPDLQSMAIQ